MYQSPYCPLLCDFNVGIKGKLSEYIIGGSSSGIMPVNLRQNSSKMQITGPEKAAKNWSRHMSIKSTTCFYFTKCFFYVFLLYKTVWRMCVTWSVQRVATNDVGRRNDVWVHQAAGTDRRVLRRPRPMLRSTRSHRQTAAWPTKSARPGTCLSLR